MQNKILIILICCSNFIFGQTTVLTPHIGISNTNFDFAFSNGSSVVTITSGGNMNITGNISLNATCYPSGKSLIMNTSGLVDTITPAFAEIKRYGGTNGATQSITNGSTYIKITVFDTNVVAKGIEADQANNNETTLKAGWYKAKCKASVGFGSATNTSVLDKNYYFAIFQDNHIITGTYGKAWIGTAGLGGTTSGNYTYYGESIVYIANAKDVDVRTYHDNGSAVTYYFFEINLILEFLAN